MTVTASSLVEVYTRNSPAYDLDPVDLGTSIYGRVIALQGCERNGQVQARVTFEHIKFGERSLARGVFETVCFHTIPNSLISGRSPQAWPFSPDVKRVDESAFRINMVTHSVETPPVVTIADIARNEEWSGIAMFSRPPIHLPLCDHSLLSENGYDCC